MSPDWGWTCPQPWSYLGLRCDCSCCLNIALHVQHIPCKSSGQPSPSRVANQVDLITIALLAGPVDCSLHSLKVPPIAWVNCGLAAPVRSGCDAPCYSYPVSPFYLDDIHLEASLLQSRMTKNVWNSRAALTCAIQMLVTTSWTAQEPAKTLLSRLAARRRELCNL